jgi:outer membrane protein insertion porin family
MLNFLGGARKLILEGKRSYFVPVRFDLKIIQPYLFTRQIHLMENPFFMHERERSYEVKRLGNALTLQKQFSRDFTGYFNYIFEKVNLQATAGSLEDLGGYDESHDKSGFTVGAQWNTVNDMFNPSAGIKLNAYMALMGIGFRSEYHYHKSELVFIQYHQLAKDWVLAGRGKIGYIGPLRESANTPLEERFLTGGANSMRGWGRHEIALLSDKGAQVGGNSLIEANLEFRYPIYKLLHGAAFVDAGNVWREAFHYPLGTLRYNLGAGLRVNTPVGPVRLDVARPVWDTKSSWQFFLSIGHAF